MVYVTEPAWHFNVRVILNWLDAGCDIKTSQSLHEALWPLCCHDRSEEQECITLFGVMQIYNEFMVDIMYKSFSTNVTLPQNCMKKSFVESVIIRVLQITGSLIRLNHFKA